MLGDEGKPKLIEGEDSQELDLDKGCEALTDWMGTYTDKPCGQYPMYTILIAGKKYLACPMHARMWTKQQRQRVSR